MTWTTYLPIMKPYYTPTNATNSHSYILFFFLHIHLFILNGFILFFFFWQENRGKLKNFQQNEAGTEIMGIYLHQQIGKLVGVTEKETEIQITK